MMKHAKSSPSLSKFAKHIIERLRSSKKALKIGVFLLIINPPLGYVSFLIGGYLSTRYEDMSYLSAATVFYAFTWVMAGIGILLAGPRGTVIAKRYFRNIFRRKRKPD